MIEFPWYVGLLGWLSILLPFVLLFYLISLVMKSREVFLGGWATALANLVAIGSVGSEPIGKGGLVLALLVILAVSCGIRLMLASCVKEGKDRDLPTDWASFGSYSLGAVISAAVTLFIFLISM